MDIVVSLAATSQNSCLSPSPFLTLALFPPVDDPSQLSCRAQLKAGFPPKDVSGSEADPVVSLGITSGSALTVLERKAPPSPTPTPTQPSPPPPPSSVPSPPPSAAASSTTSVSAAKPAPPQLQRRQEPAADPALVQSLVDMGFEQGFAAKALEVAGGDINTAVEICMSGDPAALVSDSRPSGVWFISFFCSVLSRGESV